MSCISFEVKLHASDRYWLPGKLRQEFYRTRPGPILRSFPSGEMACKRKKEGLVLQPNDLDQLIRSSSSR